MTKIKLCKEDKKLLHSISRNKGYDVGYSLLAHDIRGEAFDYIMKGSNDVNYESCKQREEWLAGAMRRMDETLPPDSVKKIREDSACCLGGERERLTKQIHDSYGTVEERFEALSRTRYIIGDTAKKVGEATYRICFWEQPQGPKGCSCLKYVPRETPMPKSWCLCCGGHIKTHFENALGVKAECTCVSSQLSSCGKEPCVFELRITERL